MTRKITRAVARIALGLEECLYLGNLDSQRDWGHARDYVRAMWLMLQQDEPDDYVIATGEQHSVREFAERAFAEIGVKLRWEGSGAEEAGVVDTVDLRRLTAARSGHLDDPVPADGEGPVLPGPSCCASTPGTTGPPRSRASSATPPRRASVSAGSRSSSSRSWSPTWCTTTSPRPVATSSSSAAASR